jgi:hypothetical protein
MLAIVVEVNQAAGEIVYSYTHLRSVVLTEHGPNGQPYQTVRLAPETITTRCAIAHFAFCDVKGKRLAVGTFAERVNKANVVLICEGGQLPDAKYLTVFKDDTLCLVRGGANASVTRDPPRTFTPKPR